LKKMGVIRHIPTHYELSNAPITVKGETPEGHFYYWGTEYKGVLKYERGVLKRRRIKYGGKDTYFIATKRPVEETKKSKIREEKKKAN